FVFEQGAALAGSIDGGAGGFDTLVLHGSSRTFRSTPKDKSSGTIALDGNVIAYAGLEPIVNTGSAADAIFDLGSGDDDATLQPDGSGGLSLTGATFESQIITLPSSSLTISGGDGKDKITIFWTIVMAASLI